MITFPFWITASISIIALIIATITDLKSREVPDYLNFSLIGLGGAIGAILSIINWSIWPILTAAGGFLAAYVFSLIMYYSGQWGGGDAKMLMGLGTLHGVTFLGPESFITQGGFPIFFTMIITILIAGAIYSLFYVIILTIIKWNKIKKTLKKEMKNKSVRVQKWISLGVLILGILFFILAPQTSMKIISISFSLMVCLGLYASSTLKIIERAVFIKTTPVNKLVEGDWIAKDVIVQGEFICGPKTLGVEETHIKQLKKHHIKTVSVKEGVPFIPGFLLGYLIILIFGNWFLTLLTLIS